MSFLKVQGLFRIKKLCYGVKYLDNWEHRNHSHPPLKVNTHKHTHTHTRIGRYIYIIYIYIYIIENWIHKRTWPYREIDFHVKPKLQLTVQGLGFSRLNNRLAGMREYWISTSTITLAISLRTKLAWRKFNPFSTRWWRKNVN